MELYIYYGIWPSTYVKNNLKNISSCPHNVLACRGKPFAHNVVLYFFNYCYLHWKMDKVCNVNNSI